MLKAPFLTQAAPPKELMSHIRTLVQNHDLWLKNLPTTYGNWTLRDGPTIVITETEMEGGYFGWSDGTVAVVSLAAWKRYSVPTSILEFVLSAVQRYTLRMTVNDKIGAHYPTRACIWDFDAHQDDAALAHLAGYLCEQCQRLIQGSTSEDALAEIENLLSHRWIGNTDTPGEVASTLRRAFGYDLARTRGPRATFWERAKEQLPMQVLSLPSVIVTALVSTFFTLLVLWIRKKFSLP
jgi:hypothetical protein